MLRDLYSNLKISRALSPLAAAVADDTAQVTQILDTKGYDSHVLAIATGTLADADATFTVLVEHGDAANLSDNAAVPDNMLNGTEALASFAFGDDNETRKIGYVGDKRYVRATITPANNTGAAPLAAVWIQGHAHQKPVA